jgi:hypothetical protein
MMSSKELTTGIDMSYRCKAFCFTLVEIAGHLDLELFDRPFLPGLPDGRLDPNIHDIFTFFGLKSTSDRLAESEQIFRREENHKNLLREAKDDFVCDEFQHL